MKTLYHFFRLIRPLNLSVIVLTMTVFQIFLSNYQSNYPNNFDYSVFTPEGLLKGSSIWDLSFLQFDFLLIVLSTVLIAAAGNIINDYFDVKADRVNKPELLIIDKYIKRRWAILFNWIFNSFGLLIAMYLGWKYQNWWIAITPFLTINLLWFYSAFFKRRFLVGNLIVALLVALVPVYVLIFHMPLKTMAMSFGDQTIVFSDYQIIGLCISIAIVAFLINLIREIIKDIADIKGDLLLNAQTIPIKMGIRKTKILLIVLGVPLLLSIVNYGRFAFSFTTFLLPESLTESDAFVPFSSLFFVATCASLSMLCTLISYLILLMTNTRKNYILSSNFLKLSMFFGLLTPLFL